MHRKMAVYAFYYTTCLQSSCVSLKHQFHISLLSDQCGYNTQSSKWVHIILTMIMLFPFTSHMNICDVYTYIYIYVYIFVHIYMCIYEYVYVHIYMYEELFTKTLLASIQKSSFQCQCQVYIMFWKRNLHKYVHIYTLYIIGKAFLSKR